MTSRYFILLTAMLVVCELCAPVALALRSQSRVDSSSYHSKGAAMSESVSSDGTKHGECASQDTAGNNVKVQYIQSPNNRPTYTLIQGAGVTNAEQAYHVCVDQHNRNIRQNAAHNFEVRRQHAQGFAAPHQEFPAPHTFDWTADYDGGYGNTLGGQHRRGGVSQNSDDFANFVNFQQQQILANQQRLHDQTLEMHNRLMQQFAGY